MDRGRYFYNLLQMQGYYGASSEYQQYFPFYHSMQSGEALPNTLQAMSQSWMSCTPQVSPSQAGSSQASQTHSSPAGSSTSLSSPSSPEAADQPGKRAYD